MHLHRDFAFNTECYGKGILGMRADDVTVGVPKLFFGYATGSNLMFPFAVGATTVLFRERATPEKLFELCDREKATVLDERADDDRQDGAGGRRGARRSPPLRACISAGEALAAELYHRWKETFGVEILDGIGSAELFHIYVSNRIGEVRPDRWPPRARLRSQGRRRRRQRRARR